MYWMRNTSNLNPKGYQPNTHGFHSSLIRSKRYFWTSDPKSPYHSLFQCIFLNCFGNLDILKTKYNQDLIKIFGKDDLSPEYCFSFEELNNIAKYYNIQIDLFYEKSIRGGRKIDLRFRTCFEFEDKVAFLVARDKPNYYIIMWPGANLKLNHLTDKRFCFNHGCWLNILTKWSNHTKDCLKCPCGKQYTRGDTHPLNCQKEHYDPKRRTPKNEIRRYKKEENGYSISNCWFADFETLIDKDLKYKVYATAIVDHANDEDFVLQYRGENALDDLMNYIIQKCDGVVWFFNGSRFDNFFIMEWLIRFRIPINKKETIICGNELLSITFKTRQGWITLKDLARFLPFSLDVNCQAFGISKDKSKGDFDHNSVNNWEDVETQRELIDHYIAQDVISLKAVYSIFSKTIFELYELYVGKFMTSSQLAYAAFTSTLSYRYKIYKTTIEDEPIMRAAYKGGRVICGRPIWKSAQYQEMEDTCTPIPYFDEKMQCWSIKEQGHCVSRLFYNSISDYLVYIDVNSLYPAAQVDRIYPIGKHTKIEFPNANEFHDKICAQLNERNPYFKHITYTSLFQVDVECPKDLTIAFLMTKNEKGEVEQNLYDKECVWFTGPELWEASKLGYKIKRIYNQIKWSKGVEIFNTFVKKTYAEKKKAMKDTPIYTCAKNLLNGLTGKFGQHLVWSYIFIFYPDEEIDVSVREVTQIRDEDDFLMAWYAVSEYTHEYCPFPIELSAFILGWARIYMSKLLRKMKITKCKKYCPIYGDTDSLILHQEAFANLKDKYKGDKELGQLKKEVKGKIMSCIVLSPKTYNIIYICEKTLEIKAITKCKGIPHYKEPYDAFEMYLCSEKEIETALNEVNFLKKRRETPGNSSKIFSKTPFELKKQAYIFRDIDQEVKYTCSKIPPLLIPQVLNRELSLECVFGCMVRKFEPGDIKDIFVARDSKSRMYNKTDWWAQGYRLPSIEPSDELYPTFYPQGHAEAEKPEETPETPLDKSLSFLKTHFTLPQQKEDFFKLLSQSFPDADPEVQSSDGVSIDFLWSECTLSLLEDNSVSVSSGQKFEFFESSQHGDLINFLKQIIK